MRRRSLSVAVAALLLSTTLPQIAFAADAPRRVLERYLAAWNAHDATAAAAFFADDVVYFDASVGTPVKGREAARLRVIENFLGAAPDARWTVKGEPVEADGKLAFEWEFSGTNTGPWGDGSPPSNKPFRFSGASVVEVKDGKIKLQSDYYDVLGFLRQLGRV